MKLPIPKEEDGKRMMVTSGTSIGRKGLLCEGRETNLVGGHETQSIRFRANMDFGNGDTPDHYAPGTDIQTNYDPLSWEPSFASRDFHLKEPTATKTYTLGSTSTPSPPSSPSPPPSKPLFGGESLPYSSESANENTSRQRLTTDKPDGDNSSERKLGPFGDATNAILAVVEDGKEPNFTANESNPTVPAPSEPSKTSTLRLSDRTRSESEDDIEKMDEPEQEGTLIRHETLYKTQTTTENTPNSEKIDKNGNRSDTDQNETDNDCAVQCLYYTIQCCECVIF